MSTNIRIARAYSVLVAASLAGHLLSMVKEILGANYFGVSGSMDAFYAALTVPNLLTNVFLSPFTVIFIPILARYRGKDLAEGNRIISAVSTIVLLVLLAFSSLAFLFPRAVMLVVSPGLPPATAADAAAMLRIMSAGVVFTGAAAILSSVINAFENFLWPAVSGMFITLSTILLMVFLTGKIGAFVLGWGLLIGTVLQFAFLVPVAARLGFRYAPALDLTHPEIRKSLHLTLVFLGVTVLGGLTAVVNRFMASWLPEGSIAALAYADKLVQVPLIIFSGALANAIYPFLSAQAAENKIDEIRDTVSLGMRMSGFIFIPLAAIMMVLAHPAIQLLYQRGRFDAAATGLTSAIFLYYCLNLLANYGVVILMRLLFAFQDFAAILKVTAVATAANVLMNLLFMRLIDPPAAGIALSTAVGSVLTASLFFLTLKKKITNLHGLAILKSLLRVALFSVPAALAAHFTWAGLAPAGAAGIPALAAALAAAAAAGALAFAGLAAVFRLEEFMKVLQLARTKFGTRPAGPERTDA